MPSFESRFSLRDKVFIDGDESIEATVSCIEFRIGGLPYAVRYECVWFHNGDMKYYVIDEYRLTLVQKRERK